MERIAKNSPPLNAMMRTTCVATLPEGGHADNALPQLAAANINCRLLPDDNIERVAGEIKKVIADDQVKVTVTTNEGASPASPLRPDITKAFDRLTDSMWPGVVTVPTMAVGITAKPVLVKLSPDLAPEDAAALAETAVAAGAAGVIATNTTTDYALLPGARDFGGLSGRVLQEKSFLVLQAIAARLRRRAVLVSVGGVGSGAEAYRRLRAGASLVQVYTALVYQGPALARRINEELLTLLERDGVGTIAEAIGADL